MREVHCGLVPSAAVTWKLPSTRTRGAARVCGVVSAVARSQRCCACVGTAVGSMSMRSAMSCAWWRSLSRVALWWWWAVVWWARAGWGWRVRGVVGIVSLRGEFVFLDSAVMLSNYSLHVLFSHTLRWMMLLSSWMSVVSPGSSMGKWPHSSSMTVRVGLWVRWMRR